MNSNDHDTRALRRLLVAEDNPVSRMIAVGLAEKLGLLAEGAADGEQLLRMLAARRYDLVLMDCEMPRLDGYAACRLLREREAGRCRTPVVALTAADGEDEREACRAAGMDDFLPKPLSLPALQALLARWVPMTDGAADMPLEADALEDVARRFGERYPELATLYLDDAPARIAALGRAVAAADCAAAARLAHAFSGSCASIGARGLSAQCRQLEQAARAGIAQGLAARVADIEAGFAEVAGRLQALLQPSPQS